MSIGNAIVNQALGAAARQATGALKKVLGNLPGSALSGSKPAFGISSNLPQSMNLQYPLNVEGDIQEGHYVMFFINKIDPAKITKYNKGVAAHNAKVATEEETGYQGDPPKNPQSTLNSAPKGALAVKRPATVRLEKAISLYMPPSIKSTYKMNYSEAEIGAAAQGIGQGVDAVISKYKSGGFMGVAKGIKNNVSDIGQGAGDMTTAFALQKLKEIENLGGPIFGLQGTIASAQILSGKIMTDKMELMFTGVGRRSFSYTFTFIPKSEKESQMVANIIFTFKKHMTPSFGSLSAFGSSTGVQGRILNIPETFDIQYMYHAKENPWLNKISTCYLSNMDVQYGSEKAGFYEPLENPAMKNAVGPAPTHTTLTLNFEEIEKMSRERIEQGF